MTATNYRNGGNVRFGLGECLLGSVLVARSKKAVCAILLGGDPDALVRELQDRFPKSVITCGDSRSHALAAKVTAFAENPAAGLDAPLDLCGTAFQQRVWQALREIPPGKTASYAEIAG